ncbi:MAG TPA: GerMN domain-containing protein [Smithellaceae bacterium]|nr:GerMN domain-containing protein [Smithellaceae bacterium]HRS88960.1 GerMN domain-containing protein [Smithellaceae bacterium]HRV25576.1 GerMN domain-containing protein [Smithellaceae bacterium]
MTTKKQLRAAAIKGHKKKKSTRMIYLLVILGSIFLVLVIFFVLLFSALFPAVNEDAGKKKERVTAIIYFSDRQERFLMPETRYVVKEENPSLQAKEIVRALLDGSKTGLVNTFPADVRLKEIIIDKFGTAFVDFDDSLIKLHPGGSAAEMASVYSLVNSLTKNVDSAKRVKILINGGEIQSLKGHISTKNAFHPDPELIVKAQEGKS